MAERILATSPVFKHSGYLAARYVLKAAYNDNGMVEKFIIHRQMWMDGKSSYGDGHYFVVTSRPIARTNVMAAFNKAYAKFLEVCQEKYKDMDHDALFGMEPTLITAKLQTK